MTARQVHFPVHDLAAAIHFYSAMFASAPAVLKPDCAKWTLNAPRVSFTIFTSDATPSEPGWLLPCAGLPPFITFPIYFTRRPKWGQTRAK